MGFIECSFLIPLLRNTDREPHGPLAWRALEDELYSAFSGSTGPQVIPDLLYKALRAVPGEYEGEAGNRIPDESMRYVAAVDRKSVDELRQILRRACNTFDQECIYLSVAGEVEFVYGSDEAGFLEGN